MQSSFIMEFYTDLLDSLPEALCVIDSRSYTIKYVNKTFSDNLIGLPFLLGKEFATEIIEQKDRAKFKNALSTVYMTTPNEVEVGYCQSLALIGENKFPVHKSYFWSLSKINQDHFLVRGILNHEKYNPKTASDMDFSAELLDFFQNAPMSFHWLTGTGHVLWANNMELETLGYTAEEYIGHHIMEFYLDEELQLTQVFTDLALGKTIRNVPYKSRCKNGDVKYFVVDSNVNFNPDGTFKHTRCFIRDNAERRIQETLHEMELKSIKAAAEGKDQFMRRVFHEIKTPLHVFNGFTTDLHERIKAVTNGTDETILEMIGGIQRNIDSILGTLEDVSFSTRFNDGQSITLDPRPNNLSTLLKDVIALVEPLETRSGQTVNISLDLSPEVQLGTVWVDPHIYRILHHLVRNAIRFSPDDSQIAISVKATHPSVVDLRELDNKKRELELSPRSTKE